MVREIPQFEAVICAGRRLGDHECNGTRQVSETKGSGLRPAFLLSGMAPVTSLRTRPFWPSQTPSGLPYGQLFLLFL